MTIKRNAGGYTLLELVMAVGIIAVLMGIGAVNVVRYQRILTRTEYDGIAREIFVAAQNHLTMAESQGFLGIPEADFGTKETDGVYYLVYPCVSGAPEMLNLMLPFASVDETVRHGGSYVIRYQREPALVLDVFYAAQSGRFFHKFTAAEVNPAWMRANSGEENKPKREHYADANGDNVIGWYGSDGQSIDTGEPLQAPKITVVNAERLSVSVDNPNTSEKFQKMGLRLVVKGVQSGKEWSYDLRASKDDDTSNPDANYSFVLDDVTQEKQRFQKVCIDSETKTPLLYPGEDITIYAEAYNNHELTNIATSASVKTNSLFASLDKDSTFPLNGYNAFSAKISNFRHLENLDCGISGITFDKLEDVSVYGKSDPFYYILEGSKKSIIIRAEQTGDMDWVKFMSVITGKSEGTADSDNVSVYYGESSASKRGHYLPVTKPVMNNGNPITTGGNIPYDGKGFKISNVKIEVAGNAGLFAALGNESAISNVSNLELWNFDVTSSGGAAGALAGVVQGCNVSGVLAAHGTKTGETSEIKGKTSVGGLVGEVKGTSTVTQSAAAVYVVSDNGDAGGLIGSVVNNGKVKVSDSYAGGHVVTIKDDADRDIGAEYDKNNCNVIATAAGKSAGGLIGSVTSTEAENLKIEYCYATTSVQGATAGGLIGSVNCGKVEHCYATGYVKETGNAGAFAGVPGTASFTDDGYFSLITGTLSAVGSGTATGISKLDTVVSAYGKGKAKPYDGFLKSYYKGLYTFRTISELRPATTSPDWMDTHYGDWPPLDTLVVNKPGS